MLTTIVITKNEQEMIGDCLQSLQFADEIIVIDNGSTDSTNHIAQKMGAKIIKSQSTSFSGARNDGLAAAMGDWILYVDADERVSPELQLEIKSIMADKSSPAAYDIPRRNFYLGREMHYGGWGNDSVIRLFQKKNLGNCKLP